LLKYKSRLALLGYQRRHGIDYEETFAPVAMSGTKAKKRRCDECFQTTELMDARIYMDIPD
jgi:hypothetical protein